MKRINGIFREMSELKVMDHKLKTMMNLELEEDEDEFFGIGGSGGVDYFTQTPITDHCRDMIEIMHGSLDVLEQGDRPVLGESGLANPVGVAPMIVVGTVREVEPGDVHASADQGLELGGPIRDRTQRADDLRSALHRSESMPQPPLRLASRNGAGVRPLPGASSRCLAECCLVAAQDCLMQQDRVA